jgi:hypothetical protein
MSFLPKLNKRKSECTDNRVSVYCNVKLYKLVNDFRRFGETRLTVLTLEG